MVAFFSPALPYVVPTTMIDVIKHLGLTSGLKLCLDAGDINSYSGSGQVWSDTSGNGYHFNRGADANAGSDDPTFNGTAGRQSSSEYWSFDGGDEFRLGQANPTWIENLHKNNAVFSYATWLYYVAGGANTESPLFCTSDSVTDVGIYLYVDHDDNRSLLDVDNGDGATGSMLIGYGGGLLTSNAWNFVAWAYTESSGTVNARVNGNFTTANIGGYASPSSSSATFTARIGKDSGSPILDAFPNGSRLNSFCMWEGTALTSDQLTALYNATKAKFGL